MAKKADIDVFSAYNVLDALHIKYGNKKNEKIPCPMCRNTTFYMNMENGVGHCFRPTCGFKANHTGYYGAHVGKDLEGAREEMYAYMGVPFERSKKSASSSTPFKAQMPKRELKKAVFEEESLILPIEERDKVNREIIASHPFIDRHKKDMKKRGLTDEEIAKLPYCSYGYSDEKALAQSYLAKGLKLLGVPGFYEDDDKQITLRKLKKGILIPFKDSEGRIQGFQLRKNNEDLKTWKENGKTKKENKCNWLSSTGLKGGTKIPAYCHYACDFVYSLEMERVIPLVKNGKITVTEGGMKGDIVHFISGESIIALPGVKALKEFEKELPFLKKIGVKCIEDAFDMDYLTNEDVQKQRDVLKEMIESNGFRYEIRTWDVKAENHADLKGLDDYLAYHYRGV